MKQVVRWHYTVCVGFFIHNMYTILDENFFSIEHFFIKFVTCTPLINMFGTYTTKQSINLFINLFGTCNGTLLMYTTYRPSTFSVVLQLKDFISENMKISKIKSKLLAKVGVFNITFRKFEHCELLFLLAGWIQHSISCNLCKYKKILSKIK